MSDRLRAICGDLRLPILDDLGVGPALDWLVLRIERLAGGEVRLERADGTRPPPDVELAFFRVAQEALSNAVKHGRPPIIVRYRVDRRRRLAVDRRRRARASPPTPACAPSTTGHFGLLNMQQRAEAIGAILDVRRWPARRDPRRSSSGAPGDGRPADPAWSVVDDHPVVRDGTAALLAAQAGIEVAGTAGSHRRGAAGAGRRVAADVVLLDIRLGTESGLAPARADRRGQPARRSSC